VDSLLIRNIFIILECLSSADSDWIDMFVFLESKGTFSMKNGTFCCVSLHAAKTALFSFEKKGSCSREGTDTQHEQLFEKKGK